MSKQFKKSQLFSVHVQRVSFRLSFDNHKSLFRLGSPLVLRMNDTEPRHHCSLGKNPIKTHYSTSNHPEKYLLTPSKIRLESGEKSLFLALHVV